MIATQFPRNPHFPSDMPRYQVLGIPDATIEHTAIDVDVDAPDFQYLESVPVPSLMLLQGSVLF